jgi:hypothetical protein
MLPDRTAGVSQESTVKSQGQSTVNSQQLSSDLSSPMVQPRQVTSTAVLRTPPLAAPSREVRYGGAAPRRWDMPLGGLETRAVPPRATRWRVRRTARTSPRVAYTAKTTMLPCMPPSLAAPSPPARLPAIACAVPPSSVARGEQFGVSALALRVLL